MNVVPCVAVLPRSPWHSSFAEHHPEHPERHRRAFSRPTGCCLAAVAGLLVLLGLVLLLKQRAQELPVVTIAAERQRQPAAVAAVTAAAAVATGETPVSAVAGSANGISGAGGSGRAAAAAGASGGAHLQQQSPHAEDCAAVLSAPPGTQSAACPACDHHRCATAGGSSTCCGRRHDDLPIIIQASCPIPVCRRPFKGGGHAAGRKAAGLERTGMWMILNLLLSHNVQSCRRRGHSAPQKSRSLSQSSLS